MSDETDEPTPPPALSASLIQQIDALELPELKSLRTYVEQRIASRRSPIESDIEADAAGEILAIEPHGEYALVRMHPPDTDGTGVNTAITSIYHVRRESQLDGTETLHWAYLGDVKHRADTHRGPDDRPLDEADDSSLESVRDDVDDGNPEQ